MNKVTVHILGEAYAIKGDADEQRILEVAHILNERMLLIAKANPHLSSAKVAVLAGLNIAEEYLRLEEDYRLLLEMVNEEKGK